MKKKNPQNVTLEGSQYLVKYIYLTTRKGGLGFPVDDSYEIYL